MSIIGFSLICFFALQVCAYAVEPSSNAQELKADKAFIEQVDDVTSTASTITNAASDIGSEIEKFKKGRGADLTKVQSSNKKTGAANEAVGHVASTVNTLVKVHKAAGEAGAMVSDFEEANETIAAARKFWDGVEAKQKDVKEKIEAAGGYYAYIDKQGGDLSLDEQRVLKKKLETFVTKKRPKLEDAEMLSMDNIDVRGTVSELANSTSGNMQILFKAIDNSIKAVDEGNGLREDLCERDVNVKEKDATLARARAKQKEIKDIVAQTYGGSWDAYMMDRYPNASDEKRKAAAARVKAAANREIKDVDTDVGVWESIDVGGSIDALASNISMIGSKAADAAVEVYTQGKNIYQGAKDGVGLVSDWSDVADAEETQKRSDFRLKAMKNSNEWDETKLVNGITIANRMIDDIRNGRASGDIEEWQTRLSVYSKRLAKKQQETKDAALVAEKAAVEAKQKKDAEDAAQKKEAQEKAAEAQKRETQLAAQKDAPPQKSAEEIEAEKQEASLRSDIPEYGALRRSQEKIWALDTRMEATDEDEGDSSFDEWQTLNDTHYELMDVARDRADTLMREAKKEMLAGLKKIYPKKKENELKQAIDYYSEALGMIVFYKEDKPDVDDQQLGSLAAAESTLAMYEEDLANIDKECAAKIEALKKRIAEKDYMTSLEAMEAKLATMEKEVASGDHRWFGSTQTHNEYYEEIVKPAKEELAACREVQNSIEVQHETSQSEKIAGCLRDIAAVKKVINFDDPKLAAAKKALINANTLRYSNYFV